MKHFNKVFLWLFMAISVLFAQIGVCAATNIDANKITPSENGTYMVEFSGAVVGRTYSIAVVKDTFLTDSESAITTDNLLYATQVEASTTKLEKNIYMPNVGNNIYTAVLGDNVGSDLKIIGYITEKKFVAVTGVSMQYSAVTIKTGESETLIATIAPADASNNTMEWKSDNTNVAVVDEKGVVTGLSDGTATITVTTEDGKFTDSCVVTVNEKGIDYTAPLIEISSASGMPDDYIQIDIVLKNNTGLTNLNLSVDYDSTALYLDKSVEGKIFDDYSKSTISKKPYTISCSSLDSTAESGIVSSMYFYVEDGAIEGNTYSITATITNAKNGSSSMSIPVIDGTFTCEEILPDVINVTGIDVSPTETSIYIGETTTIEAIVSPVDATDSSISWASTDEYIATVDENGVVTGLSEGEVTITATTTDGGFKGRCRVTVEEAIPAPIAVTGVKLSTSSVTITENDATILIATVSPEDAENKSVIWASDNESVATVDSYGVVKGISAGTAHITVTTTDGGYIASCLVTVETAPTPEPNPDQNSNPTANVDTVIAVATVSGVSGDTVDVPIVISDNVGIEAAQMSLTYDDGLTLTNVSAGTALSELNFTPSGDYSIYPFMFIWDGMANSTSNGTVLTLTFEIDEEATEGQYNICLWYEEGNIYNHDMTNINPNIVQGTINVVDYLPGDINGDHVVTVKDVTFLRRYIAKGYDISVVEKALDVNKDGSVSVKDATILSRYITGGYNIELQ